MVNDIATEQGFVYQDSDFDKIAAIIHKETGIHMTSGKSTLVYSRLIKRLRKLNMDRFDEYCTFVETPTGLSERQEMISALTTNLTSFYRENHHFTDFRERVLPRLLDKAQKGEKVRIWSAACSSGEEPYSIAFEVLNLAPEVHRLDFKILATDIDPVILGKAKAGEYSDTNAKKMPNDILAKYMDAPVSEHDPWKVKDTVKNLISYKILNLIEPWPVRGPFDVIFCRNVTIYFDPPTRDMVWEKFATVLAADGQLYVGHSERISGPAAKLLTNNGVTAYTRT